MLEVSAIFWSWYFYGVIAGWISALLVYWVFIGRKNKPEAPEQPGFSEQTNAMMAETERIGEEMLKSFKPGSMRQDRIDDLILEIEMNHQLIKHMYDELKRI